MNFYCTQCKMPFFKKKSYDEHNLEKHLIQPLFECNHCNYSGPNLQSLRRHYYSQNNHSRQQNGKLKNINTQYLPLNCSIKLSLNMYPFMNLCMSRTLYFFALSSVIVLKFLILA